MSQRKKKTKLDVLLQKALKHDRRAIAQLMSTAENDPSSRIDILAKLYWLRGKANIVGITGPPGCGKSTLISQLAKYYRKSGETVGIVAVDPSSQITGGALLGDRIRMGDLAADQRVFIRSMATRGHFGGVARATEDAVRILDAASTDQVIVETAGAGQSDVDIEALVDTTVVVTAPGLGDEIQALKAGIMEIGDIFVVNKADKEGADQTAQEIYSMISMAEPINGWRARVIKTVASTGDGITALAEAINQHARVRDSSEPALLSKDAVRLLILEAAKMYFDDVGLQKLAASKKFKVLLNQVESRKLDPFTAGRRLARVSP